MFAHYAADQSVKWAFMDGGTPLPFNKLCVTCCWLQLTGGDVADSLLQVSYLFYEDGDKVRV